MADEVTTPSTGRLHEMKRTVAMNGINLTSTLADYSCTHLQVSCVSRAAMRAVIEVANAAERPFILRVLPEQVGFSARAPGYLGFSGIADLVSWVRDRDAGGFVHLCRAGFAKDVRGANSLSDVKRGLNQDLSAGVSFFHVDGSRLGKARRAVVQQIELELELMGHLSHQAACRDLQPIFEIGGPGDAEDPAEDFMDYLDAILAGCQEHGITEPTFATAWCGTEVAELTNRALLEGGESFEALLGLDTRLADLADQAGFRGVSLIAHDCDYLAPRYFDYLHEQGVAVASLGEEFGVHETRILLQFCDLTRAASIRQDLLALALESGLWQERLLQNTSTTEMDRAVMVAHELFATEAFADIRSRLEARCGASGISLDQAICEAHQVRLLSALRHLGSHFEVVAAVH